MSNHSLLKRIMKYATDKKKLKKGILILVGREPTDQEKEDYSHIIINTIPFLKQCTDCKHYSKDSICTVYQKRKDIVYDNEKNCLSYVKEV